MSDAARIAPVTGTPPPECRVLQFGWDEYNRLIERLAVIVHESGGQFDSLLCLARGGLRPGDVLSRLLRMPLAILSTSSYREAGGTVAGAMSIADGITGTGGPLHGRVLLVDDMVDSGNTMVQVREHLMTSCPAITEIRVAVIWSKGSSTVQPDFVVQHLPDSPWIVQPFEAYDRLTIDELAAAIGKMK